MPEGVRHRAIAAADPAGEPVCILTAAGARTREVPIDRLLEHATYAAIENGYGIRLARNDLAWSMAERFIEAEAACCPSFDFEATDERDEVVVRARYAVARRPPLS